MRSGAELKDSGLRGRGGAGFPMHFKWRRARKLRLGQVKYIVCNADEGDPGAYIDKYLMGSSRTRCCWA